MFGDFVAFLDHKYFSRIGLPSEQPALMELKFNAPFQFLSDFQKIKNFCVQRLIKHVNFNMKIHSC